jgi:hypothetical protein
MTVTPERTLFRWEMAVTYYSRYEFVAASLPKWLRNDRFKNKTTTWIQKWLKESVGASRNRKL